VYDGHLCPSFINYILSKTFTSGYCYFFFLNLSSYEGEKREVLRHEMENLLTQYAVCSNCISRLWDLAGRIPSVSIVSQGVCASHGSPSIGLFTQVT